MRGSLVGSCGWGGSRTAAHLWIKKTATWEIQVLLTSSPLHWCPLFRVIVFLKYLECVLTLALNSTDTALCDLALYNSYCETPLPLFCMWGQLVWGRWCHEVGRGRGILNSERTLRILCLGSYAHSLPCTLDLNKGHRISALHKKTRVLLLYQPKTLNFCLWTQVQTSQLLKAQLTSLTTPVHAQTLDFLRNARLALFEA